MCGYESFASSVVTNQCSSPSQKFSSNMNFTNTTGNYIKHDVDSNDINGNLVQLCEIKNGESGNDTLNEPVYDDIKQIYDDFCSTKPRDRCSTIIEEFYGEF